MPIAANSSKSWNPSSLIRCSSLKWIDKLTLKVNGEQRLALQRLKEANTLLITKGAPPDRVWHLVEGDFDQAAQALRIKYSQITARRKATLSIAFSDEVDANGLLYACLPTQQLTGLPFHINADFFPSSSRKEIVLESDYQSEWNRTALEAASGLVARSFPAILGRLNPEQLWKFIEAVHLVRKEVDSRKVDPVFGSFWEALLPVLQAEPIILTTTRSSVPPTAASIEYSRRQREFVPVFEAVGIATPHDDIWGRVAEVQLRSALGVATINAARLWKAFDHKGLTVPIELRQAPPLLHGAEGLHLAWACVDAFLTEKVSTQDRKYLSTLSLVPCEDGVLRPFSGARRADRSTVELFRCVDASLPLFVETSETPRVCSLNKFRRSRWRTP